MLYDLERVVYGNSVSSQLAVVYTLVIKLQLPDASLAINRHKYCTHTYMYTQTLHGTCQLLPY